MPVALGMPPFAPIAMAPMRAVAMGSLAGHALFGLVLGAAYSAAAVRARARADV
jgi:hypothetical protein